MFTVLSKFVDLIVPSANIKKTCSYLGLLLAFFSLGIGQTYGQILKGKVVSKQGEPIAWSSLTYKDNSAGTYANDLGIFEIPLLSKDTIYVSALGYKLEKIAVQSLKTNAENIITLIENPLLIKEVIVSSKKTNKKNLRIGFFKHPDNQYTKRRGWGLRPGLSVFIYLKNNTPDLSLLLKTVLIDLKTNIYDQHRSKIRVRICKPNADQTPGEDILTTNVLENIGRLQSTAKIDLSPYNIPFPKEGVFIGIEYIGWIAPNGDLKTSWTFATRRYIYFTGVINPSFSTIGASYQWTERSSLKKTPHWFSITDGIAIKEFKGHSYAIGAELTLVQD